MKLDEQAVMDRRKEAVRAFKAGEMKSYEAIEVIRDCDKKLLAIRRGGRVHDSIFCAGAAKRKRTSAI